MYGMKALRGLSAGDPLLVVDLGAVVGNYRLLLRKIPPAARPLLMPVVKSDAYGHGLVEVSLALAQAGARAFCVGTVEEALALRRRLAGVGILALLGAGSREEVEAALREEITLMLYRPEQARLWPEQARRAAGKGLEARLRLAIKLNSGMNRLGLSPAEIPKVLEALGERSRAEFLCTHLSSADLPAELEYTRAQADLFWSVYARAVALRPGMLPSLGNSAGLLNLRDICPGRQRPQAHRPGLALYGANPFAGGTLSPLGEGLRPAMSLFAPVLEVRDLGPGVSLGYGRAFRTERDTRVVILRGGYADSVPRLLSGPADPASALGGGEVILAGRKTRILGRVCMQMLAAEAPRDDAGAYLPVRPGDWACLLGGDRSARRGGKRTPGASISACDLAARAGSIPYEIFCGLGRNKKVFLQPG